MTGKTDPPLTRRVLLVSDYFHPYIGGSETLLWTAARELANSGTQVTVLTQQIPGTAKYEIIDGVEIHRIPTPRSFDRLFFMAMALPKLLKLARRADVIHAVVYASVVPAWMAAKLYGKPVLVTVHEVFGPEWGTLAGISGFAGFALRLFEWALLRLPSTHYTCPSRFTSDKLMKVGGVPESRVHTIYCPLDYEFWDPSRHQPRDLRRELDLTESTFVYLFFGRPGATKGVEYLVDSAKIVSQRVPQSRLVMLLGRHPARRYRDILDRITSQRLNGHIIVLDPVSRDDLPSYLLAANCVVVPSLSEGFGYSAIEARTIGCPVVTTSGHAVQEVIGSFVELVQPRDSESLAERIIALSKAYCRVEPLQPKFTIAQHVHDLSTLYASLSSSKP